MSEEKEAFIPLAQETNYADLSEEVFDAKFADIHKSLNDQKHLSWGLVGGVVIGFLFTIGLIALDIMKFHDSKKEEDLSFYQYQIDELKLKQQTDLKSYQQRLYELGAKHQGNLTSYHLRSVPGAQTEHRGRRSVVRRCKSPL